MSLSKVFFGSGGRDEWIYTADTGTTSFNVERIVANGKYVWVMTWTTSGDFGRTAYGAYLTAVDVRGDQVFEKVFGDAGDTNNMYPTTDRGPSLAINPYDQDNVVVAWYISTENKWGISNIGIDGALDHSAEMGYASSTFAGPYLIGVASNGDVYAVSGTTANDGRTFLLDRSAATPYVGAVWQWDLFDFDYMAHTAVDTSNDSFVLFGRLVTGSDYRACLKTISVAGTVTHYKNIYEFNDPGDDSHAESVAVDSSGNVYLLWRSFDSSAPSNYAYVTKLSQDYTHQWSKRYTGVFQGDICLSPDETQVYALDPTTGGGTVISFAASDGEVLWESDITSTGNALGGTMKMTTNHDSVFIVGRTASKITLLKLLPSSLEGGGTFDVVTITPQALSTFSSVTPTLVNGSAARTSVTATPVDASAMVELVDLDVATTTTLKEV